MTYNFLSTKNFKQRLKKVKNTLNLWKWRGLSIHGKVNIIKTLLLPKMIYPSSVLSTPSEVIKEFNTMVFQFLWNGNGKVTRRATYAPYELGGLKMIDYENMMKALRLSWLKRIVDVDCSSFWKSYLRLLLTNQGGFFLIECNYDVKKLDISSFFYYELLLWWSELRDIADPVNNHRYIIWNNKEILIERKSVFYRQYFDHGIKYTKDILFGKTNIASFNAVKRQGLTKYNFLTWTGLRQSIPQNLRTSTSPNFKVVLNLETFQCRDYYSYLIKHVYERPRKWARLSEDFDLGDDQISDVYLLPIRVANEPYIRSFQYKVLNSILYTNDILYKIGYVSAPNCCFCHETLETLSHILFSCSFSNSFWNEVIANILNKLCGCRCLSLRQVVIGFLKEEMDLVNYIIILGKNFLWTCRCKNIKPSFIHFKRSLLDKYETEKYIAFKQTKMNMFNKKWKPFEELFLF